jgi:hypothetical protein
MHMRRFALALLGLSLLAFPTFAADDGTGEPTWQSILDERLRIFGSGNMIVVADAAFPEVSVVGVRTVLTHTPQIEVLQDVLASIDGDKRLRPHVYTTGELKFVDEQDAPGISAFRDSLFKVLAEREVNTIPQTQGALIVGETAKLCSVLVLKTDSTLPFSSVFIRLGNGSWSPEAQKRLEDSMAGGSK